MLTNKQKADIAEAIANTKNQAGQTLADLIAQAHKAAAIHNKTGEKFATAARAVRAENDRRSEAIRKAESAGNVREYIHRPERAEEDKAFNLLAEAETKAETINRAAIINETEAKFTLGLFCFYIAVIVCGLRIEGKQLQDFAEMIRAQYGDPNPDTRDRLGIYYHGGTSTWDAGDIGFIVNTSEDNRGGYTISPDQLTNGEQRERLINLLTSPAKFTTPANIAKAERIKKQATEKAEKLLAEARAQVQALTLGRVGIDYTIKNY